MSELKTTIEITFPFSRADFQGFDADGNGPKTVKDWRPGCESECMENHTEYWAHGEGQMLITEVSRYTPPGYKERVFYVRRWRDPDGNEFGSKELRCKGATAFTSMVSGYRYDYDLVDYD